MRYFAGFLYWHEWVHGEVTLAGGHGVAFAIIGGYAPVVGAGRGSHVLVDGVRIGVCI